jgi:hypothetical protein
VRRGGEHDLLWGAQGGRRRWRLRQGPFLPLLPPPRPPFRPGTPQKVMLSLLQGPRARIELRRTPLAGTLDLANVGSGHAGTAGSRGGRLQPKCRMKRAHQ